jgi:Putative transposase/Transposase zinc-binding domain
MIELQNIFNEYGQNFRENNILPDNKRKAMYSIETCRTSSLGSHVDECLSCGRVKVSYNSCRDRHCPKCQSIKKEEWIEARKSELLNVQYFHVVFTVPDSLNTIIYRNQKVMYQLLFQCVSETLTELALDKKYLGAQVGVTSILHTWGQNILYHPHIHCIVPGGGLSPTGIEFKHSKKKFFIPVKVLGRKFRGKFLHYLSQKVLSSDIVISSDIDFHALKKKLYSVDWVTYCKPPFKGPQHVIEYLGRYTHRVAISNGRIVGYKDGKVTFKWRDYKDKNIEKLMTVSAEEFIRRFLLHILPAKLFKIRHYGILSNRNKKSKLLLCQKLTGIKIEYIQKPSKREILQKIFGRDVYCCSHCGCEFVNRRFLDVSVLIE